MWMSAQQPKHQRMALTADGELQAVDPEPVTQTQQASIFCTQCGTVNWATSRYCRTCGQSLDDQIEDEPVYAVPGRKLKRSDVRLPTPQPGHQSLTASEAAMEVVTLLIVAALVLAAVLANAAWVTIPILIAWMFVEMARHGVLK
jgi:hypothetical protein